MKLLRFDDAKLVVQNDRRELGGRLSHLFRLLAYTELDIGLQVDRQADFIGGDRELAPLALGEILFVAHAVRNVHAHNPHTTVFRPAWHNGRKRYG
jgi:hypothetical protein